MATYAYIQLFVKIALGLLLVVLLLAILNVYRRKRHRDSRQRLEIIDLLAKWRDKHWSLTTLGQPNTRDILQYAPASEGVIILGRPLRPGEPDRSFTPVFAAYTENCQKTLLAFAHKKMGRGGLDPDTISTYFFAVDEPP